MPNPNPDSQEPLPLTSDQAEFLKSIPETELKPSWLPEDTVVLACTCTALHTDVECPIHGPLFRQHFVNRQVGEPYEDA